jgi:drug/metabolite transporter (DMT)-like permease
MHDHTYRRALVLMGSVVFFWGINWPIMKVGLGYMPPLWFALLRVLLGAACMFALLAMLGRLRLPGRDDMPVLISVGIFQVAGITALMHLGLQYVEAGRSAMLIYTTPLWTAPLAALVLNERFSARKAIGLLIGLAGIAVLFRPGGFDFTDGSALVGSGLLVLAAMISAAVIVHMRARGKTVSVFEQVPWQMLLGGVLLIPFTLAVEGMPAFGFSLPLAAILAYNSVIGAAFCMWAYVTVMRDLPATTTAVASLATPVVGVLSSVAFLGEPLTFM